MTILLLGHAARNDNLGVGALTVSEVAILRGIAEKHDLRLRMILLDTNDHRLSCVDGPDIEIRPVRPLREPWKLIQVLRESDLVIDISGGDSFSDIYGGRRLAIIFLQKYIAHALGRQIVMAPQTIGPFDHRFWRTLAKVTLKRSAIVATRDGLSTAFIRELGINRPVIEASDVALRLPYIPSSREAHGSVRVGLNVSGLLMHGGYSGGNDYGLKIDYPDLMRSIIRHFLEAEENCEVHLVSHVVSLSEGTVEDDYAAAQELAHEFPQAILAPRFETPSAAKSYIASMDFFVGARMHACIAALSSGVPVIPLAYSRKFSGMFGTLGYGYTVDCTVARKEDVLISIVRAFADRNRISLEIQDALGRGRRALSAYEDCVTRLLLAFQQPRSDGI